VSALVPPCSLPQQNDWIGGKRVAYRRALEDALTRIRQRLAEIPGVQKAVLFGSAARGRRDLFTDLDLLVVMQSDSEFIQRSAGSHRQKET